LNPRDVFIILPRERGREGGNMATLGFGPIDPVAALNYGVSGLGFLLALLSFWLLSKAQRDLYTPIYVFMAFSIFVIVLGLASQYMHYTFDEIHRGISVQYDNLKTENETIKKDRDAIIATQLKYNSSLSTIVLNILGEIDKLSTNIEICKHEAFGASTNTSGPDPHDCVIAAITAMKAGESALIQAQAVRGNVSALAPPPQ
jgi:hypothetical protein